MKGGADFDVPNHLLDALLCCASWYPDPERIMCALTFQP